jgi:signal transduction histidine kinase
MSTLATSKLFGQLDSSVLSSLRAMARQQAYSAGQEVFRENGPGDGLYLVLRGRVEIAAGVGDAGQHVFSTVGPGEVFGEMSVIDEKPRSANARALEVVEVLFFPREEMVALMQRSPDLSLVFLREISRRLREFNRQHLDEVLQAERLSVVGRFARSIIHDLKNPLSIIGLSAEIAAMPSSSTEMRRKAFERIGSQVERINELVGEVLEFAQGSQSTFLLVLGDYGAFVREMVQELSPDAATRQVAIELHEPQPLVSLAFNPKRLRRVFHNLVHNAIDAVSPKGGKVFVRLRATPSEVVTEIEDTGPGIAPEIAGRLFQAFATYGKSNGTGLGLSICRRIVEEHKGWISARSEPGRGAIFSFGLPSDGKAQG